MTEESQFECRQQQAFFSRKSKPILQPTQLATWTTDGDIDVLIFIYAKV
jgi:hypothetical protein